jgi:thioesterase domain-containing protein
MLMGGRIMERYGVIEKPYPRWIGELREQLFGLQSAEHMITFMEQYTSDRLPGRQHSMQALFRLLRLQTINALMSRKVHHAKLNAPLTLIKGADEDWSAFEERLGWDRFFSSVEVFTVPGNHADMLLRSARKMGECLTLQLKE